MRGFDRTLTAIALRTSGLQPLRRERRLVPAVDDPGAAALDRRALDQERVALALSLWPEASPCTVPAVFTQLPAPAMFGMAFRVSWQPAASAEDIRALQARLAAAFPAAESAAQVISRAA